MTNSNLLTTVNQVDCCKEIAVEHVQGMLISGEMDLVDQGMARELPNIRSTLLESNRAGDLESEDFAGEYALGRYKRPAGWWFGQIRDIHPEMEKRDFVFFTREHSNKDGKPRQSKIEHYTHIHLLSRDAPDQGIAEIVSQIRDFVNREDAQKYITTGECIPLGDELDYPFQQHDIVRLHLQNDTPNENFAHVIRVANKKFEVVHFLTMQQAGMYLKDQHTSEETKNEIGQLGLDRSELLYTNWRQIVTLKSIIEKVQVKISLDGHIPKDLAEGDFFCRYTCECTPKPRFETETDVLLKFNRKNTLKYSCRGASKFMFKKDLINWIVDRATCEVL